MFWLEAQVCAGTKFSQVAMRILPRMAQCLNHSERLDNLLQTLLLYPNLVVHLPVYLLCCACYSVGCNITSNPPFDGIAIGHLEIGRPVPSNDAATGLELAGLSTGVSYTLSVWTVSQGGWIDALWCYICISNPYLLKHGLTSYPECLLQRVCCHQ